MNTFLEHTTSFTESEDKASDSDHKSKQKKPAKPAKNLRSYNSFTVSEEFLYHPDAQLIDLSNYLGQYIDVKIEKKYLVQGRSIQKGQIWGTDVYTSNSDPVCVVYHSDIVTPAEIKRRNFEMLSVIFHVTKLKKNYPGSDRNGVHSKKLSNASPSVCQNIKPVAFKYMNSVKLESIYKLACKLPLTAKKRIKKQPRRIRRHHSGRFDDMIFDMTSELAFKYDFVNVYDKSTDPKNNLSFLLTSHFMVIETAGHDKYVIYSSNNEQLEFLERDIGFGLARVKNPLEFDNRLVKESESKFDEFVEVIYKDILWSEFLWGNHCVSVKEHDIVEPKSFKFYPMVN